MLIAIYQGMVWAGASFGLDSVVIDAGETSEPHQVREQQMPQWQAQMQPPPGPEPEQQYEQWSEQLQAW